MGEIVGGALTAVGGAAMCAGSVAYACAKLRKPLDTARQLLGDSSAAVPAILPPDMAALLDQIP